MADPSRLGSDASLAACASYCLTQDPNKDFVLLSMVDAALWGDQVRNRLSYFYWFYYFTSQKTKFNCLCGSEDAFGGAGAVSPLQCGTKCPDAPEERLRDETSIIFRQIGLGRQTGSDVIRVSNRGNARVSVPVIASAVAALQGAARRQLGVDYDHLTIRQLLRSTGVPVPGIEHRNPACHIDVAPSLHIPQFGVASLFDEGTRQSTLPETDRPVFSFLERLVIHCLF